MNINLLAPINPLGYGVVGTNVLLALQRHGHRVALWPIGQCQHEPQWQPQFDEAISNQHFFDPNAPSIRIWHQFDMAQHVGKRHFGWPIFELDTFNMRESYHLRTLDDIIVCSKWAEDIVLTQLPGFLHTHVVRLGVNTEVFNPSLNNQDRNWTTFLTVGKWEHRKGHDILVEAFNKAFEPRQRVRLWMMCGNPFLKPMQVGSWVKMCKSSKMGDKISILDRVGTHGQVAKIMGEATCGVFPSHAEGWNLELLEMMAMGKPVIATNYSAHTEFCTVSNCYLISVNELEKAQDGIWFHGQGNWAKMGDSQIDQLITYMRNIHQAQMEGQPLINNSGIETGQQFSWDRTARELFQAATS